MRRGRRRGVQARAADELVVTTAAVEHVVAGQGVDAVTALRAQQRVGQARAGDDIQGWRRDAGGGPRKVARRVGGDIEIPVQRAQAVQRQAGVAERVDTSKVDGGRAAGG